MRRMGDEAGFSLLGKTENGDGVAAEAIFAEWTGTQGILTFRQNREWGCWRDVAGGKPGGLAGEE